METQILVMVAAMAAMAVLGFSEGANLCRTFCGNVTVDYPFGTEEGCGHPDFRELLYCINNVLMFHVSSGSYQVTRIDYAFRQLSFFDPKMSTCASMHATPGFVLQDALSPLLRPSPDNSLLLLGCSATSPLFRGFPYTRLPCRNDTATAAAAAASCEAYYDCPAWAGLGHRTKNQKPPPCCALSFSSVVSLNLTHLHCYSYSSAFSSAPLRNPDPASWSYGLQLAFDVPDSSFCGPCKASRGVCGYNASGGSNRTQLCLCDGWNSTTTCDTGNENSGGVVRVYTAVFFASLLTGMVLNLMEKRFF